MLRPGRLDKLCYVPLPTPKQRHEILLTLTRKTPLAADVNLLDISADSRANGFSGADLAALVREAAVCCIKQTNAALVISAQNFNTAFLSVLPSVSARDERCIVQTFFSLPTFLFTKTKTLRCSQVTHPPVSSTHCRRSGIYRTASDMNDFAKKQSNKFLEFFFFR